MMQAMLIVLGDDVLSRELTSTPVHYINPRLIAPHR